MPARAELSPARIRMTLFLVLCSWLAVLSAMYPASGFAADAGASAAASGKKAAESPKPVPADPLARTTPYGAVIGFLRAVDRNDYELASRFLEGRQPLKKKEALARQLRIVLNRGLRIGLDDLSKAPEGRLDDGLNVYLEKVGTATYGDESLDIMLRRATSPDAPAVWLFSAETLQRVAEAADELEVGWGEAIWPESFREITFLSYPLFLIINQLVSLPVLLLLSWLLARGLLTLARPLFARYAAEDPDVAMGRMKWLLILLIFAAMMRTLASYSVTIAGRLVFASIATVLAIVAMSWLAVRLTRLATRAKIVRLQRAGIPSSIAAVELSGWVVTGLCIISGVFLILRTLGFEVTAAVAGLGVGGIAIAFAAQKTIENLFGTVTIVTDKPMHVGDTCLAGSTQGTVESIGLRSSRIRTIERVLVTIPNGQLAGMTISNMTHRDKFLFRHDIRLGYDTRADEVRRVLAEITGMMSAHPRLEPDTVRTRLVRFGDYWLELEVFAYVLTHDPNVFLEIQEDLLLRIMDIVEASGASVALPYSATPAAGGERERLSPAPPAEKETLRAAC